MKIHFAIDIDGTIAYRNTAVFLGMANRRLKIGLDDVTLETMSQEEFYALPDVETYKESVGTERFEYLMGWNALDPKHLRALVVAPGAYEGVRRLSEVGTITYYTARLVPALPKLSTEIVEATHEWLTTNRFPSAQDVVFCDGLTGKLQQIADKIRATGESVVLIDDLAATLRNDVRHLDTEIRAFLDASLTLCPFGTVVEQCPLSLPSWNDIDRFIETLLTEGVHHGRRSEEKRV